MITRLTGVLESLNGVRAAVAPDGGAIAYEVLVPAYLGERLAGQVGKSVTFATLQYFEGQGQGASYTPRLIGFASLQDRAFFELFTTVKGIGNRKALRAMAVEPARIAGAIVSKDAAALQRLPEIGKRLAETIIAELSGKVDAYLSPADGAEIEARSRGEAASPAVEEAIAALVALGEAPGDAERLVGRAIRGGKPPESSEQILGLVYAARG